MLQSAIFLGSPQVARPPDHGGFASHRHRESILALKVAVGRAHGDISDPEAGTALHLDLSDAEMDDGLEARHQGSG